MAIMKLADLVTYRGNCGSGPDQKHDRSCPSSGTFEPSRAEEIERLNTRLAAAHDREQRLADELDDVRRRMKTARADRDAAESTARAWQETTTKAIESAKGNLESRQQAMALLDDAFRFIAGLNLQDQPLAIQKAQREMVSKLVRVLRSPSTVADSRTAYYEAVLERLKKYAGPVEGS